MTEHTSSHIPDNDPPIEYQVRTFSAENTPLLITTEMFTTCQNLILEQANAMQDQGGGETGDEAINKLRKGLADLYELNEAVFEQMMHELTENGEYFAGDIEAAALSFGHYYLQEQEKRIEFLYGLYGSSEYEVYGTEDAVSKALHAAQLYHNPDGEITYQDVLTAMYKHDVDTNFDIFIKQIPENSNDMAQIAAKEVENEEKTARLYRKADIKDSAGEFAKEIAKAAVTGIVIGITLRARKR